MDGRPPHSNATMEVCPKLVGNRRMDTGRGASEIGKGAQLGMEGGGKKGSIVGKPLVKVG